LGFNYGKDNLALVDLDGNNVNTDYNRYNLEAFVDVFDVLDLQNNFITFLAHGGGGISTIDANETDYYQSVFNMRGGLTALIKLSRTVALKADVSTTVNISQDYTLDGASNISNAGINSTVDNMSAGLVVYLGKKGKRGQKLEHADWVVQRDTRVDRLKDEVVWIRDQMRKQRLNVTNVYNVIKECDCSVSEHVYFSNDLPKEGQTGEGVIGIQGLNSIEKIANVLLSDQNLNVYLTGSASPTKSTSYRYDLDLSKRRVEAVQDKLELLGIDPKRIKTSYFGKDKDRDEIHEFARKVSLEVK